MSSALVYFLVLMSGLSVILLVLLVLRNHRGAFSALEGCFDSLEKGQERMERALREEIAKNREETMYYNRQAREELNNSFGTFGDSVLSRIVEASSAQKTQLDIFASQLANLTAQNTQKLDRINETMEQKFRILTQSNEEKLERMRETVDGRLRSIQEDTGRKLEQMRATVDEKLHDTLEKRLGESFRIVSERLEMVHKGLGEMQTLASGVGDLKKVLTNVKTRGTFGEIQLGNLLEQILTSDQYETNVMTKKGSNARVEFAIKLPGRDEKQENVVWLPIDAKFPQEDYLRLVEAQEEGSPVPVEEASKQLEKTIKEMARLIKEKYLDPPNTTDFGVMFLPTEGLYAEVLRRTGVFESLQREYRVVITGPTTLAALLNSLQMGFRTLAIERRSSDVWSLLGAVKTEFANFGAILDKTQKKLQEASNTIDTAARRSRAIERKLKDVQEAPEANGATLLGETEEDAVA
ncbi:MAG: DNA recombination protein RmuC [Pseudomonadota bacterium]